MVKANIQYLIETHRARITKQLEQLRIKLRVLEIIEEMKKTNTLKGLFDLDSAGALKYIQDKYKVDSDIASKVLQKPLSSLTKEHDQEIAGLKSEISELENDKNDIYDFLSRKYKALKKELSPVIRNKFAPTTFVKG